MGAALGDLYPVLHNPVHKSVHVINSPAPIGGCQLNTLAKIGCALGVRTKRLYNESADSSLNKLQSIQDNKTQHETDHAEGE